MAGLYGADSSLINRLPKQWYAQQDGATRQLKEMYGVAGGVNRKVFNRDIIAKYKSFSSTAYTVYPNGDENYPTNIPPRNYSTESMLDIGGYISSGTSSNYGESGYTNLKASIDDGNIYTGQSLLQIKGPISITATGKSRQPTIKVAYWTISAYSGSTYLGSTQLNMFGEFPLDLGGTTINMDRVFQAPSISSNPTNYEISISIDYKIGGGSTDTTVQMQIPWSAFTWLPVGSPLTYQP